MRVFGIVTAALAALCVGFPASGQTACTDPTSPAGHAVCLGIPDGPPENLGSCLGNGGFGDCDPLNWNGAKFSTVALTTSPTRTDYYFAAHNNRILHNYQTLSGGNWTWGPSPSSEVQEFLEIGIQRGPLTSVGLGTVLHQPGVIFDTPASTTNYNYAMYMIYQFDPPQGSAGHVCVSFSQDGVGGWTPPIRVVTQAQALQPACNNVGCDHLFSETADCKVHVEAFSGFFMPNPTSTTGTVLFAGLEGKLTDLACETYENSTPLPPNATTLTSLYRVTTDKPHVVEPLGVLPLDGMKSPTFPAPGQPNGNPNGRSHLLFINLDFVYDPLAERVVLSRVYPFPFDHDDPTGTECTNRSAFPWAIDFADFLGLGTHDDNAPCDVGFDGSTPVCPTHVGTLPTRGQIYSKSFRGKDVDSINTFLTEPWTLDFDLGRNSGWSAKDGQGNCGPRFPTMMDYQLDIGVDIDSLGFLRTPEGWIPEAAAGLRTFLGGYLDINNACQETNLEFEYTLQAHQYTIELPRVNLFSDGFESGTVDRWGNDECPEQSGSGCN